MKSKGNKERMPVFSFSRMSSLTSLFSVAKNKRKRSMRPVNSIVLSILSASKSQSFEFYRTCHRTSLLGYCVESKCNRFAEGTLECYDGVIAVLKFPSDDKLSYNGAISRSKDTA